jgi:hypothetical protein
LTCRLDLGLTLRRRRLCSWLLLRARPLALLGFVRLALLGYSRTVVMTVLLTAFGLYDLRLLFCVTAIVPRVPVGILSIGLFRYICVGVVRIGLRFSMTRGRFWLTGVSLPLLVLLRFSARA